VAATALEKKRMVRFRQSKRGFTLIEMAIVLSVISILVAVVAPDFIEIARNDLAEQSAGEVTAIFDAAKWSYHESSPMNPESMHWPGDPDADSVENGPRGIEDCLTGMGGGCVRMLPPSALRNPWDQNYEAYIDPPSGGLIVRTNVPTSVAGVMRSYMPGGECAAPYNGGVAPGFCNTGPPAPPGMTRCCGMIPKPGNEASIASVGMTEAACDAVGGTYNGSTYECNLYFSEASGALCENRSTCEPGEVSRGIRCGGKYCNDPKMVCCKATPE
ncbi:MAG: type II secretion system protein, partial [Myxococcota bacterium]